jgi:hypothetical protein
VLKLRKVSGVETLSLRHHETGSFAIPREWTDWEPPETSREPTTDQQPLLFDAAGALALAELVHALKRNNGARPMIRSLNQSPDHTFDSFR